MPPNFLCNLLQLFLRVFRLSHPVVAEVGSRNIRALQVLALRHAQRGVTFSQDVEDLIVEPGIVAEFKTKPCALRKLLQEFFQQDWVSLQKWRKLKQHHADSFLLDQRLQCAQKTTR